MKYILVYWLVGAILSSVSYREAKDNAEVKPDIETLESLLGENMVFFLAVIAGGFIWVPCWVIEKLKAR